jgi:glyoxylase-like metal-dependent hydrolase (beta-lactamase superfamily II)
MLTIEVLTFGPFQENTYLLFNEAREAAIIDPGCYQDYEKKMLLKAITDLQLQPKFLLNTHCHLDHVFGNKLVAETFDLQPWIHPKEAPVLQRAPESGLRFGLPFDSYEGPLQWLEEGTELVLGEDRLKILFTPGHSPGSVAFYCEAQLFVIGGDVLFRQSIGRTDLPGGDHQTLLNSIRRELWPLPDSVVVYSGHGTQTTIGHEKRENPFLKAGT